MNLQVKRVKENKPDLTLADLEIFHSDCGGGKVVATVSQNNYYSWILKCQRCLAENRLHASSQSGPPDASRIFKTAVTGENEELLFGKVESIE